MSNLPACHRCGSSCVDTNEDGDFFFFRCGSSSGQESDACEYVSDLRNYIEQAQIIIETLDRKGTSILHGIGRRLLGQEAQGE